MKRRIFLAILAGMFLMFFTATPVFAVTPGAASNGSQFLAAAIAFGLAAFGAGIGVGTSGSAAIAAIAEKPNLFGRALIFVVLGEGIAIYGFVVVFILPTS